MSLICLPTTIITKISNVSNSDVIISKENWQGCWCCRGRLQDSTMVHDEEAEISIRLATLIANSQRNHSVVEPLPQAPGNGAVPDGDAIPKTEASQGIAASPF